MPFNVILLWYLMQQKPAFSESSGHDPEGKDWAGLFIVLAAVIVFVGLFLAAPRR